MSRDLVHFLPLVTTTLSVLFGIVLFRHWRRKPQATYLMWWTLGVVVYGLGTLSESLTSINGWSEPVFRMWYITGALMGGVFLAQGTVYLLLRRATADRWSKILVAYLTVASVMVLLTPIDMSAVEPFRLSGKVMEWQWVRLFSPFVNTYALFWLVGGAIWSAIRYFRRSTGTARRVWGNAIIAVGALLPGIGGSFARFGRVEVLYVTELIGLALIWAGYRMIVTDRTPSIHEAQVSAGEITG